MRCDNGGIVCGIEENSEFPDPAFEAVLEGGEVCGGLRRTVDIGVLDGG